VCISSSKANALPNFGFFMQQGNPTYRLGRVAQPRIPTSGCASVVAE
jgi:hypothetical protein